MSYWSLEEILSVSTSTLEIVDRGAYNDITDLLEGVSIFGSPLIRAYYSSSGLELTNQDKLSISFMIRCGSNYIT